MLYKRAKSKFTPASVGSLVSTACAHGYIGAALSFLVFNGDQVFKLFMKPQIPDSWAALLILPISLLSLVLSVHFLEPWLVLKGKHWIAHNPKKVMVLSLGSELLINNVLLVYLSSKGYLVERSTL